MSWATPDDITAIYEDANISQPFIDHVQGLAETCAGTMNEPVTPQLKAVFIDVVYRKWMAGENNPEGKTMETLGPYNYQMPSVPALGLTKTECKALKKAAGKKGLSVLPLTIGQPVETPPLRPYEADYGPEGWA